MNATEVRTVFAASLKRWRHQRGFSQENLAERANLHRTYISDVERGARNLSLESINRLAAALEISIPRLFSPELPGLPSAGDAAPCNSLPSEFVDIILVEDNPDDVTLTLQAFTKARFANSVRVVRDGAAALDLFFGKGGFANCIQDPQQHIILLDLNLPKVNGLEVLRQLKADPRTRDIPVAILTASNQERDAAECLSLGVQAYITKPVSLEGLSRVTPQLRLTWALVKPLASASGKTAGAVRLS
jgi:CheY-like chemotaxis protein